MGEIEGIGDAVTGGLLARAVEPNAGEAGPDGHTQELSCLNCGALLAGPYCSACGQKAHVHRSLRAFFGDFAAGLVNFEGKFWRTLPMLAWRPGDLTRRYIQGERARFISPVALYLFTVFLMFATLNFSGALDPSFNTVKKGVAEEITLEQKKIAVLEKQRAEAAGNAAEQARLDRLIANRREDIRRLEGVRAGVVIDDDDIGSDTPAWVRDVVMRTRDNPERTVIQIQDAASKFSWLLIPFSLPFMWLLFPFSRRYRMFDHTVFVTYSLSFMMILVIAGGLLVWANIPALAGMLVLLPPFHMYRQLKGAYPQGRIMALIRTSALVVFSFVAASLFAVAVVGLGVIG